MNATLKTLLLLGSLTVGSLAMPETTNADHRPYWRSYWGWYDSTYVPYQRYYYSEPYYDYGYSGSYYGPDYYNAAPYTRYYAPGPRVGVRVDGDRARVRFGWW